MDVYGWNANEWDVDVLRKLVEASQLCDPATDYQHITALQRTTYPEQTGHPVEREEAVRIAWEAMGVTDGQLFRAICVSASPNPVWRIHFRDDGAPQETRFGMAEVDSVTGEVTFSERRERFWNWAETIVTQQELDETWEYMEEHANG